MGELLHDDEEEDSFAFDDTSTDEVNELSGLYFVSNSSEFVVAPAADDDDDVFLDSISDSILEMSHFLGLTTTGLIRLDVDECGKTGGLISDKGEMYLLCSADAEDEEAMAE